MIRGMDYPYPDAETVFVKPSDLQEGDPVFDRSGPKPRLKVVDSTERVYNVWGPDEWRIEFTDGSHTYVSETLTVEVEC